MIIRRPGDRGIEGLEVAMVRTQSGNEALETDPSVESYLSEERAAHERVSRVREFAFDYFHHELMVNDFLNQRHLLLDQARPIEIAVESEEGAERVINILGSAKYGNIA